MDRYERFEDPEEALRKALRGFQTGVWTSLPCQVLSFDAAKNTVEVQPLIMGKYRTPQGQDQDIVMPVLADCPVLWPSGGGFTLTFPIAPGDECLVFFASRCIDAWWQSSGVQPQAEFRMHDLSDGFALVGPRSVPRAVAGVSGSSTQLRTDSGETFVEVGAGFVNIIADTINISGRVVTTQAEAVLTTRMTNAYGTRWYPPSAEHPLGYMESWTIGVDGESFPPPVPE